MNTDQILNTDTGDSIQGHVGKDTKQIFFTVHAKPFKFPKLKLEGYEFLQVDQFGNHYFKMRALLADGEMYDVDQYVKPSMMIRTGGGFADFEDSDAKKKLRVTDDLFAELREQGKLTLARTNLDVMKARSLTTAPVAIEAKDITAAALALEKSIEDAKKKAGEWLEEKVAPGLEPVKSTKLDTPTESLPGVILDPTGSPMYSTAPNMHHHAKGQPDHNAAHGQAASHSGKTGNKNHDAGMGKGHDNMSKAGTPHRDTFRGAGKAHAHGNGT